jgi:mannose-6-phosphate isomerase-like protein (cupin superfamily)
LGDVRMIKRANDMIKELRHEMRGGKGSVELMHVFNKDEMTGKARLFAKITLNPGCSIGMHEHDKEEEIYYVISGKGIINDNGNIKELNSGDASITGNGASHSIENNGSEPLELLAAILLF